MLEELRRKLVEAVDMADDLSDARIYEAIDELVLEAGRLERLSLKEKEELRKDLFYSVRKLDVIQELIDDPEVNEIMVNGYKKIFFEKGGSIHRFHKQFSSETRLYAVIQQIAGGCNRVVNEQSPILDARLKNGDRVNVVLPPVALDGPVLTVRRFPKEPVTMEKLTAWGSISAEAAEVLKRLAAAGYTIIVSGGTSTGKTTFLNALSEFIPKGERIVTIEDNAELQLKSIENLVRLETKPANLEENREITIRDLIKTALRMRPSRIIIGEVRGAETADFLNCLNTGHSGSLGSVHANSPEDLVYRLEMMVRMGMELPIPVIRQMIASGIEIIVHLCRDASGKRMVEKICEVKGFDGENIILNTLYKTVADGKIERKNGIIHAEKLEKYEKNFSGKEKGQ
jgi:pilus assembly protein CpaF